MRLSSKKSKQKDEAHAKFLSLSKDEAKEYIKKYGKSTTQQIELAKDWKENHISVDSVMDEENWLGGDSYSWRDDAQDSYSSNEGFWSGFWIVFFFGLLGVIVELIVASTSKNQDIGHNHLKGAGIGFLAHMLAWGIIVSCANSMRQSQISSY